MPFWKQNKPTKAEAATEKIFEYEPLTETNDFRLLELLPGGASDQVKCRLSLASLVTQPLYNAVSYTWGEPPANRPILVNDQHFKVRSNLYELLEDLRHPRHSQTYWVDAICINQEDDSERGIQVESESTLILRERCAVKAPNLFGFMNHTY